jgi:hypothetical protein
VALYTLFAGPLPDTAQPFTKTIGGVSVQVTPFPADGRRWLSATYVPTACSVIRVRTAIPDAGDRLAEDEMPLASDVLEVRTPAFPETSVMVDLAQR